VVLASAQGGNSVVRRPWLGAKLQAVTPEISEAFGLKRPAGALVGTVTAKSPAERAGLRTGDLIVAIDDQVVEDPNTFDYRFATKTMGGQAQIGVLRSGREMRVVVALDPAPESPRDERVIRSRSPFMGAKVSNMSPALAEELRLDATLQGAIIVELTEGSAAHGMGFFRKGDVIVAVNGEKIGHPRDLDRVASQPSRLWRITILRDGQTLSVAFGG
ncbi:MAG: PDZ domain-containing protein, partial [Rhodoplanes sp.]